MSNSEVTRTTFHKLLVSIATCLAMSMQQAIAEAPLSNVDKLIAVNKWRDAARAIFLEASATDKHESSVIVGQAKGGFVNDAIDTISRTHPNSWADHFLSLAQVASGVSPEKRNEFVRKSLEAARNQTGDSVNYVKSYSLINIALYYSKSGADSDARKTFAEAMTAAEKGLTENGSGGFRNITQAMKDASPDALRDWMLPVLIESLGKPLEATSQAFSCIDMVSVAGRLGKPEQALVFVECARSAIGKISDRSKSKRANEGLADAAQDIGLAYAGASVSPYGEAIREARSGNANKSYDIVTNLNANLYTDHKLSAYSEVLNDAIRRNDLRTAHFFAERALRKGLSQEVGVWQKIAEKEVELGEKKSARESYAHAVSALHPGESRYYVADVLIFVRLGESMLRNGLNVEGRRVILLTLPLLEGSSDKRRKDDLVIASAAAAESLWKIGMRAEAKHFLQDAYQLASAFDAGKVSYGASEKARLLAVVGSAAVTFSSGNSPKRSGKQLK